MIRRVLRKTHKRYDKISFKRIKFPNPLFLNTFFENSACVMKIVMVNLYTLKETTNQCKGKIHYDYSITYHGLGD